MFANPNFNPTSLISRCLKYFCLLVLSAANVLWVSSQAQADQSNPKKNTPKKAAVSKQSNNPAQKTSVKPAKPVDKKNSAPAPPKKAPPRGSSNTKAKLPVVPIHSIARKTGLHEVVDPLGLNASVAYVIDKNTGEILLGKNEGAVLPIASITKVMTAMLIIEAMLPMDDMITITKEDIDTVKNSSSRLPVGSRLTRRALLKLALMSSENRAAHALARTWPGGTKVFIERMNARSKQLGMYNTHFADSSGVSPNNRSNARDLALLVQAANRIPLMRELTTEQEYQIALGKNTINYKNSNSLVRTGWGEIEFQKTGFINEAGRCVVMLIQTAGRDIIMVLLDAVSTSARTADVKRVSEWIERNMSMTNSTISATPQR